MTTVSVLTAHGYQRDTSKIRGHVMQEKVRVQGHDARPGQARITQIMGDVALERRGPRATLTALTTVPIIPNEQSVMRGAKVANATGIDDIL